MTIRYVTPLELVALLVQNNIPFRCYTENEVYMIEIMYADKTWTLDAYRLSTTTDAFYELKNLLEGSNK